MHLSGTCYFCLSMVVVTSIFIANIISLIAVYSLQDSDVSFYSYNNDVGPDEDPVGSSKDNLMWFVQVSDIHISIFHDKSRISDFKEFCSVAVKAISPTVVIASGDLTDAKSMNNMGSRQYEKEWIIYRDLLNKSNVVDNTVWLDIRGNHDNFNVLNWNSEVNYYRSYSIQGREHSKSYLYQIKGSQGEIYSFIGLDACVEPGPKRPFNFIGLLKQKDVDVLREIKRKTQSNQKHYNIWFGHYPTSCIITPSDFKLRKFIGSDPASLAYLCGHLHNMGGIVHNMYALQQTGFLELELIDWKENRMFRVAAIDHGFFSFIDVHLNQWPVILITNPKHADFVMGHKESLARIRNSTHVRVLVFSVSAIKQVKVKFNNGNWSTCDHVEGPLYVAKWSPENFSTGVHEITVHAEDVDGREQSVSQPFALDKPRNNFDFFARLLLMANISSAFQVMFGVMIVICTVPLCIVRLCNQRIFSSKMKKPAIEVSFFRNWIRRLWILGNIDSFFFPLIFYPLFLAFGPWCVGEIVEGHFGVIFAWGILVNQTYLPGGFTYAYGFNQLFIFHIPLMMLLSHALDARLYTPIRPRQSIWAHIKNGFCSRNLLFFLLLSVQTVFAFSFSLAYGILAFFLNFLRTWPIILALWLWFKTVSVPDRVIRNAAAAWLPS